MASGEEAEVGFAKLQGEDFEYYMQSYSIVLGRNSKRAEVDVDLTRLGGGMSISRKHARIFYDFSRRRFSLQVLGKNGCFVEGVLHLPGTGTGTGTVKLDSQDLLQIGEKKFYFLLPIRSVFASEAAMRSRPPGLISGVYDDHEDEEEEEDRDEYLSKRIRTGKIATKAMKRSRADREADDHQLMLLEENDVLSSVASVLSDTCRIGEWMPLKNLHAEMVERYGNLWHHSRVRKYLSWEDRLERVAEGKPWFGLLALLRKFPQQFVINTRSEGSASTDFVALVSFIS